MRTFFVQSGTLRMKVHAEQPDRAALWAVHQVLAQVLPVFDDDELSAQEKQAVASFNGMLALDAQIRLSELGFDRDDALCFDTSEVMTEWSQLVIALQKIDELSLRDSPARELSLAV